MMEIRIKNKNNFKTDSEVFTYFHIGKERSKKISIEYDKEDLIFRYEDEINFLPFDKKLDVVYEDEHILAVNKEREMLVHPDNENNNKTLVNMVASYYHNTGQNISVMYIGRLDYDTTGLVLFAKDILTHAYLSNLVENNQLHRNYLLLCFGKFDNDKGVINKPIGRDRHDAKKMRISKTGKEAITFYEVLKRYKKYNLVKASLKTGRTHQIRLHFASNNNPLLGDKLYGSSDYQQLMLHSYEIKFELPFYEKEYDIKVDLPSEMKKLI